MRYPGFLPDGGRIGFVAPSFGCTTEPYATAFDSACEALSGMGYRLTEGPNCRLALGCGKSNTPQKCAEELSDFFLNDRADVILSVGGGETMCEDLSYLDFEALAKAPPRWFMGYSDNTNLTFTLPTLCDTAAIYGPCAPAFGQRPRHPAVDDALAVLRGQKLTLHHYPAWESEEDEAEIADRPLAPYNAKEPFCMTLYTPDGSDRACVSGRLLGGCLDVLVGLAGTRFDRVREFCRRYESDGVLWFLEACELSPIGVRRALWQLREAGWFDTARGFLIGRPGRFNESGMGLDRHSAVTGLLSELGVPIFMDLDIGHLPPMMPLICGANATAVAADQRFTLQMRLD